MCEAVVVLEKLGYRGFASTNPTTNAHKHPALLPSQICLTLIPQRSLDSRSDKFQFQDGVRSEVRGKQRVRRSTSRSESLYLISSNHHRVVILARLSASKSSMCRYHAGECRYHISSVYSHTRTKPYLILLTCDA